MDKREAITTIIENVLPDTPESERAYKRAAEQLRPGMYPTVRRRTEIREVALSMQQRAQVLAQADPEPLRTQAEQARQVAARKRREAAEAIQQAQAAEQAASNAEATIREHATQRDTLQKTVGLEPVAALAVRDDLIAAGIDTEKADALLARFEPEGEPCKS